MKVKKVRLSRELLVGKYCTVADKITFTPLLQNILGTSYSKRIIIRVEGQVGYRFVRYRGKAPLHKKFTLDEFIDRFYLVWYNDPETGLKEYYFKYYKK